MVVGIKPAIRSDLILARRPGRRQDAGVGASRLVRLSYP
jgi:hypothetical protein